MNKRILGRTNIEVSEISFGTVSIGIPYGIGMSGQEDKPSESEAIELLQSALDKGINFFDTARGYGCSEELIGKAFRNRREDVVISTKSAHLYNKNKQLLSDNELRDVIDNSIKKSLSALQTDYVDIYMVHNADLKVLSNKTVAEVFSEYKRKGLTRAIGVSTYTVDQTRKAIESGIWDVVQLGYNLMDQRQGELFALAHKHGVGVVVRSVLFKGILTGRGDNLHPKLKSVQKYRAVYDKLLNKHAPTLSELATKFVLSQKQVSSVLVGIDRREYLEQALAVANGRYLDDETLTKARELAYPEPEFLDLHKWDVMGWLT
jgi:1-deoxyxylulose-5-phosphate synthase